MELAGHFFSAEWMTLYGGLYAFVLYKAARWADWGRLKESNQFNAFVGCLMGLAVLWSLRTEVEDGLIWHLSGMVSLTLMFRASLAIIGGSLVLVAMSLLGLSDWTGFFPTAMIHIVFPALFASTILALTRCYLPKNYFIYVFVNAFAAAGTVMILAAWLTVGALVAAAPEAVARLTETYMTILPLLFFPEAVLNGWIMSVMVGFKPHWVASFRDEEYLDGK